MSSLTRTLVILLGVAATACSRCSPPQEFEFYVEGVPHTVDDAEDMDDPPDVEVTVKKGQKAHSGNVACGHSAVCIIVLPFVVGEAIFPEHYRVVTVKKSGAVWYSGLYRGNGEFMHGVITEKGQARRIDLVNASYVGRKVVVETAHGPLGPDGKPGKLEDSSVQKQVDLLSEYEKVLALGWPADKRGRALAEALRILHHDAVPLAKKQLAEHPEYAFRAPVIRNVCKDETPALSAKADRDAVIDAVLASKPDAATALAAAECYRQDLGDPRAAKLLRIVLTELCAEPKEGTFNSFQAFALGDVDAKTLPPPGKDARADSVRKVVAPMLAECGDRGVRALLQRVLGLGDADAVRVALAETPPWGQRIAAFTLDPKDADDHATLAWALGQKSVSFATIVKRLDLSDVTPDDAETTALVDRYRESKGEVGERIPALRRVGRAKDPKSARARVSRYLATEKDASERIALRALLVSLQGKEHRAKLIRESVDEVCRAPSVPAATSGSGAPSAATSGSGAPSGSAAPEVAQCELDVGFTPPDLAKKVGELAFHALRDSGCTFSEVRAAYSAARAKETLPEPLCEAAEP